MIRDFSEKAKQKLEGYADDAAASSTWGKIKDWFSDRGMGFRSWTGKLGIENYINDVDTKSMAAMNRQITCGNNIIKLINDFAASISPDGGTMDFVYDDKNSRVTLTERNGSRITYVHDSRYRNTATLYEDGTREKYLYNDRNQCISDG